MRSETVQAKRARTATIVIVVLAVVLVGSCAITSGCEGGAARFSASQAHADAIWRQMMDGTSLESALSQAGFLPLAGQDAPSWFKQEVLEIGDELEGAASPDWSVVWLARNGSVEEVLTDMEKRLSEKGWSGYESGLSGAATFMKEGGTCRWALVQCACIEGETSVVLCVQHV